MTSPDELADRTIRLTEEFLPFAREEIARAEAIHNLRQREGRTLGTKRRDGLKTLRRVATRLEDATAQLLGDPRPSVLRERRRLEVRRAERLASD
jgi:hypothetical protein